MRWHFLENNSARIFLLRYFWFRIFEMAIFLLTSSFGDFCGLLLACSEQHRRGQEERAETREALTHLALPDPNPAQNCWLKKVEIKLILGELICWSWDDIFLLINSEIIFVEMTSFWRFWYSGGVSVTGISWNLTFCMLEGVFAYRGPSYSVAGRWVLKIYGSPLSPGLRDDTNPKSKRERLQGVRLAGSAACSHARQAHRQWYCHLALFTSTTISCPLKLRQAQHKERAHEVSGALLLGVFKTPPSMRNRCSHFCGNCNASPPVSRRLPIYFDQFSVIFNQFQSVSTSFSHFSSGFNQFDKVEDAGIDSQSEGGDSNTALLGGSKPCRVSA